MTEPPVIAAGQRVVGEPRRLRHELCWTIELPERRRVVVAQLAPELAAEPALRRRWVADMERLAALAIPRLAPILSIGPAPDPRDVTAAPPWRMRADPDGPTLDHVLERAPLPIDEAIELLARLADAVQTFHAAGAVIRDLDPRTIVIAADGQVWFTDVGHARLAILSSRTASSLLVESSPYVAGEALLQTVVDARADVYSLGVVLWRALTGRVPFEASLIAAQTALPDLRALRPDVPEPLVRLVTRCLAREPEQRPPTARDVAEALRGRGTELALAVTRVPCQACGEPMRAGLHLCLACGKQAVQFRHATPGNPDAGTLVLHRATDDAAFVAALHDFFAAVAADMPGLNFVTGDRRMYDKAELAQRHAIPAVLLADLDPETSRALLARLRAAGLRVDAVTPREIARKRKASRQILGGAGGAAALSVAGLVLGGAGAALSGLGLITAAVVGAIAALQLRRERMPAKLPIAQLRAGPVALPAGDAQVARIAAALAQTTSPDVRARLEELALLAQRLADAEELARLGKRIADGDAEPAGDAGAPAVRGIVELACTTADAIAAIDQQLASLDEDALVRALARCEARNEAPELRLELLAGLDTLRGLEDQRATLFGRLLEITSLGHAAIIHGLRRLAALRSDDIELAHALASLDDT